MADSEKITVSTEKLVDIVQTAFQSAGVNPQEAGEVAASLVQAEIQGVRSHGLVRVPLYINRIKAGGIKLPTRIKVVHDNGLGAIVDSNNGLGQVAGRFAMELAIEKARKHGIGACSVRHSSHFGAAGYYAAMAARSGMIGFACCNASSRLPAWGGKEKLVGNNPFSVSFPTQDPTAPFLMDMANSVTAAGWLRTALQKGAAIPEGWALDKEGKPTTDPQMALEGILLPMAGHKGYAIALTIGILTATLSGGCWDDGVVEPDRHDAIQNVSHLFLALDISKWLPLESFKQRIADILDRVHSTSLAHGIKQVYYPGEREAIMAKNAMEKGIRIEKNFFEYLMNDV